jgi:hypothetical protein
MTRSWTIIESMLVHALAILPVMMTASVGTFIPVALVIFVTTKLFILDVFLGIIAASMTMMVACCVAIMIVTKINMREDHDYRGS